MYISSMAHHRPSRGNEASMNTGNLWTHSHPTVLFWSPGYETSFNLCAKKCYNFDGSCFNYHIRISNRPWMNNVKIRTAMCICVKHFLEQSVSPHDLRQDEGKPFSLRYRLSKLERSETRRERELEPVWCDLVICQVEYM